ncbi:glycosyltransferase family 4 protein [Mucilaginibacter sp. HMF5004]|uniref:glycosyltransferase family 4 protein n=1 Tax=Mucilaginibacter rivuli TaxID=2857527 RepID=UPI001C5D8FFE|nr:glycosyltransferase family 4 protein [Mucilaginibacter rivuli]MBW4890087.1 glycosyltransferase family 4 protein [Mucilaginibacter rivuli]
MKPKVLLTHPGTQYSYHLAEQLERLGLLYKYVTSFTIPSDGVIKTVYNLLPKSVKRKLGTRLINIPACKVKQNPVLELKALIKIKQGETSEAAFYERNKAFQLAISDELIKEADIVIGFDTSSWILAERCKKLGKRFILDVSIGHPIAKESIYKQLADLYPEWLEQIKPKSDILIGLESQEIELADAIVVPSDFVRGTYVNNGVIPDKIIVNPFGTNVAAFNNVPHQYTSPSFLFFGGLTARKGLPFLLKVWADIIKKYPECTLILAGYGRLPDGTLLPENVKNLGIIAPAERQKIFDMADIFVFPSFFEGLAQVQIEAAACGLPVIGTTQSGATNLVAEGKSGFVIIPGDSTALFNAMEYFIQNPHQIKIMGACAREISLGNFTWDSYGDRWEKILVNEV